MKLKRFWTALVGAMLILALGVAAVACDSDTTTDGGGDGDTTVAVEEVTLDKTSATLIVGETLTLTATVTPDNATDKTVSWLSSNDAVATVENGTVTAVAEGIATITATAGGKNATCVVTVQEEGVTVDSIDGLIEALESGENDVIRLAAGTYELTETLSISARGVSVIGSGSVVLTADADGWTGTANAEKNLISINAAENFTLSNVTVQGSLRNGVNVWQSTEVTLENVVSRNNAAAGVLVNDSSVTLNAVTTEGNAWAVNVDEGEKTNTTELTVDAACSFGETLQIYCDSTEQTVSVNVPDTYHQADVTLVGAGEYRVWTTQEALKDGMTIVPATPDTITYSVAAMQDGYVLYLTAGTYEGDISVAYDNVTVVGDGEDKTVVKGSIILGSDKAGVDGAVYTVTGLTVESTGDPAKQLGIMLNSNSKLTNGTLAIQSVTIRNHLFGTQLGSAITNSTIALSDVTFENVWCAISVKNGTGFENSYTGADTCTFTDCTYQLQNWSPNEYFEVIGGAETDGSTVEVPTPDVWYAQVTGTGE